MKICILGAGALGSLVGGLLSRENEVTLIGREAHMKAVSDDGLKITGHTELAVHPETATTPDACQDCDLIILTVKSYDTKEATASALPFLSPKTGILSLQNGLGNIETIAEHLPKENIIGGVTCHGATFIDSGQVWHAGPGDTVIGRAFSDNDGFIQELAEILTKAGIRTRTTDNIFGEIWAKAIVNAVINPLTAIMKTKNGFLLHSERLKGTMKEIVDECVAVVEASDVVLPEGDMLEKTIEVVKQTAENKSSMLQDVENRRRTEINSINGQIVRRGDELGIPVWANRSMEVLVKAMEDRNRMTG